MKCRPATALILVLALAATGEAQEPADDGAVETRSVVRHARLVDYETRVEIPREGQVPYVVGIEVPAQTLRGDRFQALLRRTEPGKPPVKAFGRLRPAGDFNGDGTVDGRDFLLWRRADDADARGDVAMEELVLAVESIEYDPTRNRFVGRYLVTGAKHQFHRDKPHVAVGTTGTFEIELPNLLLKHIEGTDVSTG